MKCEKCGADPSVDCHIELHRVNPLGEIGVWRCYNCLTPAQLEEVDPIVEDISGLISGRKHSKP